MYDATGNLEDTETLNGEAFDDLYSFYREMFPKISEEDIEMVWFSSQPVGIALCRTDISKQWSIIECSQYCFNKGMLAVWQVEAEYRGSDEEKRDLLQYYSKFKGDMHQAC